MVSFDMSSAAQGILPRSSLSRVISVSLVYSRIKAALGINVLDLRLHYNGIHI